MQAPALLAAFLIGASAASAPALAGKGDDTLNAAFSAEITTLDPCKKSGREGLVMARLIYDALLYKDIKTGEFKPELANPIRSSTTRRSTSSFARTSSSTMVRR